MKIDWKSTIKSYFIIALGSVIYALGFDLFYAPNDVALGGITGLAQVINHVLPALPVGVLTIAMNIPLFLLGWKYIGFKLLVGSLVSMLVGSTAIDVIAANFTFAPMDPMLAALCGGAVMGLGIGMVFTQGASTGGTDIVARLLRLKMPWLPLGKLMMLPDGIVLTSAVFAFGKLETGLYGLAALFVCTRVMDTVLYGMDTSKIAYIVSDKWEEMCSTILELRRGVTLLQGQGAYTGKETKILMLAFKQKEIVRIKRAVHQVDPDAFMMVCNANEVLGLGFGEYKKEDMGNG